MFSKELFGQRLKEIRLNAGETQAQLCEVLSINKSRVSAMEKGINTTTAEKIALICEHYQVSSDYLLSLVDDPRDRLKSKEPRG